MMTRILLQWCPIHLSGSQRFAPALDVGKRGTQLVGPEE